VGSRASLLASVLLALATARVAAEPRPLAAEVIWARGAHFVLASTDSLPIDPGDRLTVFSRGTPVASGEVTQLIAGEIAVARLTSGSLNRVKKLRSLRVTVERARLNPPPALRIALPARNRSNALFACGGGTLRSPGSRGTYQADSLTERSWRFTRKANADSSDPWPDTLVVSLFEEIADEEIALERGETDVAVFWPGELSEHVREDLRWRGYPLGTWARGVVAAVGSVPAGVSPDEGALASMNESVFRGDLMPWRGGSKVPAVPNSAGSNPAPHPSGPRFEVLRSCPGWQAMERALNRGPTPHTGPLDGPASSEPTVRLGYVDGSIDFSAAIHGTPLFTLRCPVVCEARLRSYVAALGADSFAAMLDCSPSAGRP
jgi:hypothetical protein